MNFIRIAGMSSVAFAFWAGPAFAGTTAPGPIAGVGLPALVLIGGAYWVGRKLFARKQ